ncbi:MAG: NADH:ubiquinone reductase (Na(+)-transporting) subunit C [Bacteroidetes bacterium]|nr:MAG: NADH:ubiquinone reductase (Na(+)-transporting) subunit C [Bacteroidota bacterium]
MHSNSYTLIYAAGISIITAVILAVTSEGLKPLQEANVALDKKSNILKSVRITSADRKTIEDTYSQHVTALVVNSAGEELSDVLAEDVALKDQINKPAEERLLPLYEFAGDDGKKFYIIPMRGVGLWGPIWGYLALEGDFNTVYGAFFDHKGETPGLGAEIAEKPFQDQFQGKTIMTEQNQFISVNVVKPTDKVSFGDEHRVDGISGGTITSRGTDAMLKNCIEPYLAYFEKLKSNAGQ